MTVGKEKGDRRCQKKINSPSAFKSCYIAQVKEIGLKEDIRNAKMKRFRGIFKD